MYNGKTVCVIVPAYNEAKKISETLTTIPDWVDRVIAIDDKSKDTTLEEMKKLVSSISKLRIIALPTNSGVGYALATGYKESIAESFDISVVMDGDGQMDPNELDRLVEPITLGQTDMSKGNRFYSSESFRSMPLIRVIGNVALGLLNKIGSGYWSIVDPQNGYIAISNKTLRTLNLDKMVHGYSFQNDFLCKLRLIDARILDVNIPARYLDEVSTLKIVPTSISILRTLSRGFLRRVFIKNFLWSFSISSLAFILALMLGLMSLLSGVWVIYTSRGSLTQTAGTVTFVALLFLSSLALSLTWLVLDVLSEPKARN